MSELTPLVQMVNICKNFNSIMSLKDVNFSVGQAEVVGLLGDNGAGKSTLIKVLTGIHFLDKGEIYFEGKAVHISSPRAARNLGIETVYQDLALIPLMSIARNFCLGREPLKGIGPFKSLDRNEMNRITRECLGDIGIRIRSADEEVLVLSGGERQSIAIGRAVHYGVKLLIMDEPTSDLSINETNKVLDYMLKAKGKGLSVIFISHNIHHVYQVADRFTILKHGAKMGDFNKGDCTANEISDLVAGNIEPEDLKR